jgi:hypothetical protein
MEVTLDALKAVVEGSQGQSAWAIAVLGGSIALVVGTSHSSPHSTQGRLFYLLFIPGWMALLSSLYYSDLISRNYLAAQFVGKSGLEEISRRMHDNYVNQNFWFKMSIYCISLWMSLYLVWWIFARSGRP